MEAITLFRTHCPLVGRAMLSTTGHAEYTSVSVTVSKTHQNAHLGLTADSVLTGIKINLEYVVHIFMKVNQMMGEMVLDPSSHGGSSLETPATFTGNGLNL